MPGQAGWRLRLFRSLSLDPTDQLQVLLEVLALEARRGAPEVAFRQVLESLNLPGQKAASQRTVSNEANTQLAHRRQDLILHVAAPQGVLRLQRGYGVYLVRPPYRLGGRLRDAKVTTFPASTSSLIAPQVSSTGVSGSTRCW